MAATRMGMTVGLALALLLVGVGYSLISYWLAPQAGVATPVAIAATGVTRLASSTSVTGAWLEATPIAVLLAVHVDASVSGAGSIHAVAVSVGGQTTAHLDSTGGASGHAVANAPVCGACGGACASCVALPSGDRRDAYGLETGDLATPTPRSPAQPHVVVTVGSLNLRSGPGLGYAVVGMATQSDEFVLSGRSVDGAWWQVCCVNAASAWLSDQYVQAYESAGIAVVPPSPPSTSPSSVVPTLTVQPTLAPVATPTPMLVTVRVQKQPEANNLTVFVYVHDQAGQALGGYTVHLTHAGTPSPGANSVTVAHELGTTYAGQGEKAALDDVYNAKTSYDSRTIYPGYDPLGNWHAWLTDGGGQVASELVGWTIEPADANKQVYLEFVRR